MIFGNNFEGKTTLLGVDNSKPIFPFFQRRRKFWENLG